MSVGETIQKAIDDNPEILIVLDIAARARNAESREQPRELGSATEVVAIPTHTQHGL